MANTAISHLRDEAVALFNKHLSYTKTAEVLCAKYPDLPGPRWVRELVALEIDEICMSQDVLDENAKLRREKLKNQDKLRKERATHRVNDRKTNASEELLTEIRDNLKLVGNGLKKLQKYSGPFRKKGTCLLLHLSDLHLQSIIDTPTNQFDFVVAAKRLQLLAQKVKLMGEAYGATKLVVAMGGDFLKNDKRSDEFLNNACNKAKAVTISVHLLRQLLLDLRQDFYIDVFGVAGNESRSKEELGWSEEAVTDNYDASIYWCLEQVLAGQEDKGLRFHPFSGNEAVFTIHNETILLLHGHQLNFAQQKSIQSVIGKYSTQGINITHIIGGHIHAASISDYSSRSSSLCGGDPYAYNALNYASKASQNLHIISKNHMDGVKLDLQSIDNITGYDVLDETQRLGARVLGSEVSVRKHEPVKII